MYNIYKLTNELDGKSYIGQTKRNINSRMAEHKFSANKRQQSKVHAAIFEFGINQFSIRVLETCEDGLENQREQYWVSFYDTTNHDKGYNVAKGGRGNPGLEVSKETREKLRILNKGFTAEAREIIRLKQIGRKLSESHAEIARSNGLRQSRSILQYSINGELLNEFPSIIEASRSTGADRRTIQRQLKGESKLDGSNRSTANIKFIWKLKE
jgi:group I intron endonuclease